MKFFNLITSVFFITVFASCGPNYIFEEDKTIAGSAWTYADSLSFDFNISDTTKVYNLYIELEHSTEYQFQNLYVNVKTKFPNETELSQPLSLELADKFGNWLGNCGSENCKIVVPIQEQVYFQQSGAYQIILEQFMREDPMPGINKFGLKIEETDLKKE